MSEDLSDPFDDPNWCGTARPVHRVKRIKGDSFIGCPMLWIEAVWQNVQSKEQLMVALLLYRHHSLYRGKPFAFSNAEMSALCIDRHAKYRALANLEGAGLIEVERANGRLPLIAVTWRGSNHPYVSRDNRTEEQ
jgi:hypothetical protein